MARSAPPPRAAHKRKGPFPAAGSKGREGREARDERETRPGKPGARLRPDGGAPRRAGDRESRPAQRPRHLVLIGGLQLLQAIEASPEPADRVRHAWMQQNHRRFLPDEREKIIQLGEEVLRHRGKLDWWLHRALGSEGPIDARHRLAALRILQGGKAAALLETLFPLGDEAVALGLARLEGHTLDHPDQPLAARFSLPDWIEPRFRVRFGSDLELELAAMLKPAPLDVRVNRLKTTREAAQAALQAEGLRCQATPFSPLGLRLSPLAYVNNGAAYREGLLEPQDEGSQIAALLVDAVGQKQVVDFCAGAGGKTLALAGAMQNSGRLIACDVSEKRLARAKLRLRRAGAHNAETRALESKWLKRHAGTADRVLVDAPCSGSGTWRRKPDARWRLTEKDVAELVPLQADILDRAAKLVKAGGRLIYVTCSVLTEENDAQIEAFLARQNGAFRTIPVGEIWPSAVGGPCPVQTAWLHLTPGRHGTDGFFVAILQRI